MEGAAGFPPALARALLEHHLRAHADAAERGAAADGVATYPDVGAAAVTGSRKRLRPGSGVPGAGPLKVTPEAADLLSLVLTQLVRETVARGAAESARRSGANSAATAAAGGTSAVVTIGAVDIAHVAPQLLFDLT